MIARSINSSEVRIAENILEFFEYSVKMLSAAAEEAIRKRGKFSLALSGGSTPKDFFSYLSRNEHFMYWEATHIFSVDERHTAHSDRESNAHLISDSLLSGISIPSRNIHFVPFVDTVHESARLYEHDIRTFFAHEKARFDFIFLGIGIDGHTASLFPGEDYINDDDSLVIPVDKYFKGYQRISLTLEFINQARNILFCVTGGEKADIVRRVATFSDVSLPAAHVHPYNGTLTFLLDSHAAASL
jgi:6-phosphogluconolactonase